MICGCEFGFVDLWLLPVGVGGLVSWLTVFCFGGFDFALRVYFFCWILVWVPFLVFSVWGLVVGSLFWWLLLVGFALFIWCFSGL